MCQLIITNENNDDDDDDEFAWQHFILTKTQCSKLADIWPGIQLV